VQIAEARAGFEATTGTSFPRVTPKLLLSHVELRVLGRKCVAPTITIPVEVERKQAVKAAIFALLNVVVVSALLAFHFPDRINRA